MVRVFVLFTSVFILNAIHCFGQFDPKAYAILDAEIELSNGERANCYLVQHSFNDQFFLSKIQKEYGVLTKLEDKSNGDTVYSTTEIKNKRWSEDDVFLIINLSNNNEIYPLGKNQFYFEGKLVDSPKYITTFYLLDKNQKDILDSKKSQKKFKTYLNNLIKKITN